MFLVLKELVADFDLEEESALVQVIYASRLFMLPSLLQIDAIAWAIERHLALLAAALRADATVDSRAEALLAPLFANRANHWYETPKDIMTSAWT